MQKGGDGDGVSHTGDDEDDDPEVTAITRRLDRTGDTLGAIGELEQLLIERTGQIPVVSPELLAAHGARIAHAQESAAPEPAPEPVAEPQPDPGDPDVIDWSIPPRAPLDPAPGFSAWVDPEQISAAFDAEAAAEFADVSTKVFAVFSAERADETGPVFAVAAPQAAQSAPVISAVPVPEQAGGAEELDELDGIDDLVDAPPPPPTASPEPAAVADDTAEAAEAKPRRRFWPFGRR